MERVRKSKKGKGEKKREEGGRGREEKRREGEGHILNTLLKSEIYRSKGPMLVIVICHFCTRISVS